MSEQEEQQSNSSVHRASSDRKSKGFTDQTSILPFQPQRPTSDDREAGYDYWVKLGQPWRTEPEIDIRRQEELTKCLATEPNIGLDIYPFNGMKLSRADIEWLLVTHENRRGPVDWNDESQRKREGLDLRGTDLRKANLVGLPLARALLYRANLEKAQLGSVHLEGARLQGVNLKGAMIGNIYRISPDGNRQEAHLDEAYLWGVNLENANLEMVHLEETCLAEAHLEGANLHQAHLEGSDLTGAFFNSATYMDGIFLGNEKYGFISLEGARWDGVNLSGVDWVHMKMLGDEQRARRRKSKYGRIENAAIRIREYRESTRANRQLSVVLRDQGLNEEADHFAYRAQLLQRVVWRRERRILKYILSWFLYLIAGYGYRPLRTLIIYLLLILGFATGYFAVTQVLHAQPYPLTWYEALILSVSSFHGRGFFQPVRSLGDPVAILASIEAIFGLLIEISFIATFTQRFFGK